MEHTLINRTKTKLFGQKWRVFWAQDSNVCVMVSNLTYKTEFAPLIIKRFPLVGTHLYEETKRLNLQYSDPTEITGTADKLRWYRNRKGLRQQDVADYVGIARNTYMHYEKRDLGYYPTEYIRKIAELLEVNPEELLDDYNRFLYRGQGKQIRAARRKLKMTEAQFAAHLGIREKTLTQWEKEQSQIRRKTWERYFK